MKSLDRPASRQEKRSYRCECGATLRGYGIPEEVAARFVEIHLEQGHKFLDKTKRPRRASFCAWCGRTDCGGKGSF